MGPGRAYAHRRPWQHPSNANSAVMKNVKPVGVMEAFTEMSKETLGAQAVQQGENPCRQHL